MAIDVRNVTKAYGRFTSVKDVSFSVAAGELVALLGPSGSGKTTLLRIIAGLETADAGTVMLGGEDATATNARDRAVGCFPAQSAAASVIPGVIFSGTTDGWFRAYDSKSGKPIWQFNSTAQTYDTVNQVKAQPGGSLDGLGAAIAGGRVFVMSGFNGAANTGGNPTNVLLAYSVDGK